MRGKNTRGRFLAFKGAGKAPAVKSSAGKKSAGKDPRTKMFCIYLVNWYIGGLIVEVVHALKI